VGPRLPLELRVRYRHTPAQAPAAPHAQVTGTRDTLYAAAGLVFLHVKDLTVFEGEPATRRPDPEQVVRFVRITSPTNPTP
jgi:hypothetical protein